MAGYIHGCGSGSRNAQKVSRVNTLPTRSQRIGCGEAAAIEVHVVGATMRVAYQIPIITLIGPIFAAVATGSFFVEAVFNIPGMGKYYVESFVAKDQPMILAVTLIYAVMLAAMNVVVDVLYGFIDPRIRY